MKPTPVKLPQRYPVAGRLVKYSGILMLVMGFLLFIWGSEQADEWLWMVFALSLIGGGVFNWMRGLRLASVSVEQLRQHDKRAPVIFLRSFGDEKADYSVRGFFAALQTAFRAQAATGTQPMISPWGPTFQIQLASLWRGLGPYVAIGRPGEEIADTGAARTYVSDAVWQQQVADWLQEARLVVLRPGSSAGVSIELQMLRAWNKPERILLIMPHTEKAYQGFRQVASDILPQVFPEQLPQAHFMRFDRQWNPYELPQQATLLATLEPFLVQNGLSSRDFSLTYKLLYEYVWFMTLLVLVGLVLGISMLSAVLG